MDFTTIEKFCISNFYTDIHEITLPDDVAKPRFAESLSGNYNVKNFLKNLDRRYGITTRTRSFTVFSFRKNVEIFFGKHLRR